MAGHSPLHECAIDRAFPENNQERGEECFVHRDGHFYPVGFTASPIRDDLAHIIGTIIEVRDISEEKAAAERQRLLINELNHRVKNTLATVQSIAAQTFRGQTDQAVRGCSTPVWPRCRPPQRSGRGQLGKCQFAQRH